MNPKLYRITSSVRGRLAISARPRGGDWLEDEIEGWHSQGINVVVSLLTPSKNEESGLNQEARFSKTRGIRFVSFPIKDRGIPLSSEKVEHLVAQLGAEIQQGKNLAIHCRQGIGRSSLVSAAVLISAGEDVDQAL